MPGHLDVAVSQSETAAGKHLILLLEVTMKALMVGKQHLKPPPLKELLKRQPH